MIEILLENTMLVLDILIKHYKQGTLSHDDFINHTQLKVNFLKENMKCLKDSKERNHADDILKTYNEIISFPA